MKVPIIEYPITVDGHVVATALTEGEAKLAAERLQTLGVPLAGPVGYGPSKRIVEADSLDGLVLDVPALAEAFDKAEQAKVVPAEEPVEPVEASLK